MQAKIIPFILLSCFLINFSAADEKLPSSLYGPGTGIDQNPFAEDVFKPDTAAIIPTHKFDLNIPKGAENIHLTLKDIVFDKENLHISAEEIQKIYGSHIGRRISLAEAYHIAGEITALYYKKGFFLSRAYIPSQTIKDGVLHINIIEGYIKEVEVNEAIKNNTIIQQYIDELLAQRPSNMKLLESILLRLNEIPGITFRAILTKLENDNKDTHKGAIKLLLMSEKKQHETSLALNNGISSDMGFGHITGSYKRSFMPLTETSISAGTAIPDFRIKNVSLNHQCMIAKNSVLSIYGSGIMSKPESMIKNLDLAVKSSNIKTMLNYSVIKQRDKKLSFSIALDIKNNYVDAASTNVFKDKIRALRAGMSFDTRDKFNGRNILDVTVSHGLNIFGASKYMDSNVSRALADPNFYKLEGVYARSQPITKSFSALTKVVMQWSSSTLYAAETLSYGGIFIGRGYDTSEFIGDRGAIGSVELHYNFYNTSPNFGSPVAYVFYDFGMLRPKSQPDTNSQDFKKHNLSSIGIGLRTELQGLSFDAALAQPISKKQNNAGREPRLIFQISKKL